MTEALFVIIALVTVLPLSILIYLAFYYSKKYAAEPAIEPVESPANALVTYIDPHTCGIFYALENDPTGIPCDGRVLNKKAYPLLFDSVGYNYSYKVKDRKFLSLRRFLGLTTCDRVLSVPEGYFRLPDLRPRTWKK